MLGVDCGFLSINKPLHHFATRKLDLDQGLPRVGRIIRRAAWARTHWEQFVIHRFAEWLFYLSPDSNGERLPFVQVKRFLNGGLRVGADQLGHDGAAGLSKGETGFDCVLLLVWGGLQVIGEPLAEYDEGRQSCSGGRRGRSGRERRY